MATTAQCPSCSTRFRVVPDQLKISKGWVRCGKCSEVFDARFSLSGFGPVPDFLRVDPAGADAVPAPHQVSIILRQESEERTGEPFADSVDLLLDLPDAEPEPGRRGDLPTQDSVAAGGEVQQADDLGKPLTSDAQVSEPVTERSPEAGFVWALEDVPRSLLQASAPDPARSSNVEPTVETPAVTSPEEGADSSSEAPQAAVSPSDEWRHEVPEPMWDMSPSPAPSVDAVRPATVGFVRQARRKAFWQRAGVRVMLMGCVLSLTLALAVQVLLHERDKLAAHWPTSRPWLMGVCDWVGCKVETLRHIEAISIANTDLTRLKTGSYRFDVVLRNGSDVPLALPLVELALTNRQSETVASRVIFPDQWLTPVLELPPRAETQLSVPLQWQAPDAVSTDGFRAEVFYP